MTREVQLKARDEAIRAARTWLAEWERTRELSDLSRAVAELGAAYEHARFAAITT
jgi:hypothetical protein